MLSKSQFENRESGYEPLKHVETPIGEGRVLIVRDNMAHDTPYRLEKNKTSASGVVDVLILNSSSGEVIDFNRLATENSESGRGVSFKIAKFEMVDLGYRTVFVVPEILSDPKNIFGILHEIGHILTYDTRKGIEKKQYSKARNTFYDYEDGGPLSEEEILLILKEERDAWAAAIRLARTLKKDYKIDLFGLFKDLEEFKIWLRATGLRYYELEAENLGVKAFTKQDKSGVWEKWDQELVSEEDFRDDTGRHEAV